MVQMDEDLINEFAIYAQDDDNEVNAGHQYEGVAENPNPSFFSFDKKQEKAEKTIPEYEYNDYGDRVQSLAQAPKPEAEAS